jgi:uncharacterized protein
VRAVLDANVVVSALLSPRGVPAELLRAHRAGEFELVVSPALLAELERALGSPKLRRRIAEADAREFVADLARDATQAPDPDRAELSVRSRDPDDDYLVALAARQRCALVSGDADLLALAGRIPVFTPRDFLDLVRARER